MTLLNSAIVAKNRYVPQKEAVRLCGRGKTWKHFCESISYTDPLVNYHILQVFPSYINLSCGYLSLNALNRHIRQNRCNLLWVEVEDQCLNLPLPPFGFGQDSRWKQLHYVFAKML